MGENDDIHEPARPFELRGTLYRQLFDLSPSPAIVHDGRTVLAANKAAAEFFGFATPEDAIGAPLPKYIHPEDLPKVADRVRRMLENDEHVGSAVERYIRTDGSVVYGDTIAARLYGYDQPLIHVLITDVTEKVKVEKELREAEERYRRLFELAPDPTLVHDGERILQASESAIQFLGWRADELIGRPILDIVRPESQHNVLGRMKEMLATGNRPPHAEIVIMTASGKRRVVEIASTPIIMEGKRVIVAVLRDLTERRAAEASAREHRERYLAVIESAPVGIHLYELDDDGRLVFVGANPAADRILGIANEELVGKTITEAFPGLDAEIIAEYKNVALTGEPWTSEQVEYSEGEISGAFSVSAFRTFGHNVAVVFEDVTVQRRLEAERDRYRDQLEERVRERTEELSTIRYELNAITTVVVKAVEMRDPYTAGHQERVARLAVRIAEQLAMNAEEIERVRVAAVLHDVGKLSVPAEILAKPAKLTRAEYELVKGHPEAAFEILREVELDWPLSDMVVQHHERMDGSGYPNGLIGDAIILGARILAVADVVEAMSSHRPYRPSKGVESALEEIEKNRGTCYDDGVVDACLRVFEAGFSFE